MSTQTRQAPQTSQKTLILGFFYAALAATLWSLITPFSRELFALNVAPLETAFWRSILGGLCFALYSLARGTLKVPFRDGLNMTILGGLFGALMFGAFQVSIERSGGATAVILLYTAPAWVAIVSRFLYHEPISRVKLAAIAIALLGVVLVSFSGGSASSTFSAVGVAAGILSSVGYAAYFPFTFHYVRKFQVQTLYAYAFFGSALVLFPLILPMDLGKSGFAWGMLALMSVLTNFGAYIALGLSLKCISQVQSAIVGNIEPVLGTLWVWLLFGENFRATGWFGCALIMLAVFLLTLEKGARTS